MYRIDSGDPAVFTNKLKKIMDDITIVDYDLWIGGNFNINFALPNDVKFQPLKIFLNTCHLKINWENHKAQG